MTLLLRFWPYLLGGALAIGVAMYINRLGYESGYNASESKWRLVADAANKALLEANERTRTLEASSRALSQKAEAEHAQTLASLQTRYADADVRIRGLVREHAKRASRCELPPVPGATTVPDAASSSAERADRAGGQLTDLARRCEADAATLTALQQWVRENQALR
jgi:hypothetical protein